MTPDLILAEMAAGEFCQPQFDFTSEIPDQTIGFCCDAPSLDVEPIAKLGERRIASEIARKTTLQFLERWFVHGS